MSLEHVSSRNSLVRQLRFSCLHAMRCEARCQRSKELTNLLRIVNPRGRSIGKGVAAPCATRKGSLHIGPEQ